MIESLKEVRENLNKALEAVDALEAQQPPEKEWCADDLEVGDAYWTISIDAKVMESSWHTSPYHSLKLMQGHVFKTEEQASYHLDMMKLAQKIKAHSFTPDWGGKEQEKTTLYYSFTDESIHSHTCCTLLEVGTCFKTKEIALAAVKDVSDKDFIYMIDKGLI